MPTSARARLSTNKTGRFLEHDHLGTQLMDFIGRPEILTAPLGDGTRVSCFGSTETLNRVLRQDAQPTAKNGPKTSRSTTGGQIRSCSIGADANVWPGF